MNYRFVCDTNVLISAALLQNSLSAKAFDHALNIGRIALSEPVFLEFEEVIFRRKFDKYFLSDAERIDVINRVEQHALFYLPKVEVTLCRDSKDNKFLELDLAASASAIISGDADLLVLNPFENIPILSVTDFLKVF